MRFRENAGPLAARKSSLTIESHNSGKMHTLHLEINIPHWGYVIVHNKVDKSFIAKNLLAEGGKK